MMRDTVHVVLKTGIDIGSIDVKEKESDTSRPIVVVNNIPRPNTMSGNEVIDRQLRNGVSVLITGGK
jgi:hypothetical protein